jgi:hypothetical protein
MIASSRGGQPGMNTSTGSERPIENQLAKEQRLLTE